MGFSFDTCANKLSAPGSERTSDSTVQREKTQRQGHSAYPIHVESVKQARWGQRICAVPAGGWYSMGTISQYGLLLLSDAPGSCFLEIVTFDLHAEDIYAM